MAEMILTSETPSNPSPLNPPSRIICHVCQKQFSQYTCPRCNSRYCSLPCYKSHSVRCTETFMKENVVDELRQVRSDDQTKRKILEILKRFHAEEEEGDDGVDRMDDEDSSLSEEIIEKVLSGNEVSLDDLTLEERKRFERAIASGELSKLIEPWEPWWLLPSARTTRLSPEGTQLIQCISEETSKTGEIPRGPDTPLPPLSQLTATNPSPLLNVHLVDVLYSYCFTLRIYNGDWQSDSLGSATMLLSISSVLSQKAQPATIKEVVSCCLEQTCSPAYKHMGGLKLGLTLLDDVVSLLSLASAALICSLCDVERIMVQAATLKSSRDVKKKLRLAERKVFFLMCWVHEQPQEAWSELADIVRTEKNTVVEIMSEAQRVMGSDRRSKDPVKIEEMERL